MARQRYTLRQLGVFAAVMRTGQVKRAAAALHLSQAAVSQALQELAAALELTLFERRGRELVPTVAARQLLTLIGEPLAALDELPARLNPDVHAAGLRGDIRIAASSTITRYLLPAALARLRQAHPELTLNVISGNSATVEARVADLDADVGFIEGPAQRADLKVRAWRTDPLQVIAPPDYPVAGIRAATLAEHPWVLREPGSGTRAVFEQSLALAGYPAPRASLVIDDSGAIVRAVAAGAGLACVSRRAAQIAGARSPVARVDLPGLTLERPLWRVQRGDSFAAPLLRQACAALDAALASLA